jgi:hypothetical protein
MIIDRSWVRPEERFVTIHLDLVAEVGWVKAALVTRLAFRTTPRSLEAVTVDGILWWRANLDDLADELHLTKSVMQKNLRDLVTDGTIIRTKHRFKGPGDQTYSYRINHGEPADDEAPEPAESSLLQNGNMVDPEPATSADSSLLQIGNIEVANRQHLSSVKEVINPPTPQGGTVTDPATPKPDEHRMFDQLWDAYPKHEDRNAAIIEWYRVVRGGVSQLELILAATRFAEQVRTTNADPRFVKTLGNWLRAGSYDNPLPEPPKNPYPLLAKDH